MDKEDLLYAVERVKRFIEQSDEDTINKILMHGQPITSVMIPPNWACYSEDYSRGFIRLELRVR